MALLFQVSSQGGFGILHAKDDETNHLNQYCIMYSSAIQPLPTTLAKAVSCHWLLSNRHIRLSEVCETDTGKLKPF